MSIQDENHDKVMEILRERFGKRLSEFSFPPPVFITMEGEFVAFDLKAETLSARFPVLLRHLNPYGYMQGGMIAAAVDNTIGPLSALIAPMNVTRNLEMKYSLPITLDTVEILVEARLVKRDGKWLHFTADVRDEAGNRMARAKAVHVIVGYQGD